MIMKSNTSPVNPKIALFWEGYCTTLNLFRIPDGVHPWYRKHIEAFINFLPETRLVHRNSEHVEPWLTLIGRNVKLEDWQYRQQVDALRLLFCHHLKLPWAVDFDWAYWSSGAMRLEASHGTTARTYEMIDKAVESPASYFAKSFPSFSSRSPSQSII